MFFIFDRFFKSLVLGGFRAKFVDLHFNQGMAFGLNLFNPKILTLIVGTILLLVIWGLIKLYQTPENQTKWGYIAGLTSIFFGALANLIDRWLYHQVVDYINLDVWPVFNLADAMIVVGAVIIVLVDFIQNKRRLIRR
ncbi:Peptidase A8, signal peptidase II [sediment metagenome]|uniref:Peptidase A8, signal peptidase II n=1 Tax=sediment metagenome TaxID=749907 RepID=D9PFD9_9ZZZZ